MQNFSDRLAQAILHSGKAKGTLAADCGVALSTVSRWLGGAIPKAETVALIAKSLGVDAKWLLAGNAHDDQAPQGIVANLRRLFGVELAAGPSFSMEDRALRGGPSNSISPDDLKSLKMASAILDDYMKKPEDLSSLFIAHQVIRAIALERLEQLPPGPLRDEWVHLKDG